VLLQLGPARKLKPKVLPVVSVHRGSEVARVWFRQLALLVQQLDNARRFGFNQIYAQQ
jgi:hypothetical protein